MDADFTTDLQFNKLHKRI